MFEERVKRRRYFWHSDIVRLRLERRIRKHLRRLMSGKRTSIAFQKRIEGELIKLRGRQFAEELRQVVADSTFGSIDRANVGQLLDLVNPGEAFRMLVSEFYQKESDSEISAAASALSLLRNGDLVEGMAPALRDSNSRRCIEAAYLLGHSNDVRAVPLLEHLALDPGAPLDARNSAAEGLGYLGRPRSVPVLVQGLSDRCAEFRFWCTFALGLHCQEGHPAINSQSVMDALVSVLDDHAEMQGYWSVRLEALAALGLSAPGAMGYRTRMLAEMKRIEHDLGATAEDRRWLNWYAPLAPVKDP